MSENQGLSYPIKVERAQNVLTIIPEILHPAQIDGQGHIQRVIPVLEGNNDIWTDREIMALLTYIDINYNLYKKYIKHFCNSLTKSVFKDRNPKDIENQILNLRRIYRQQHTTRSYMEKSVRNSVWYDDLVKLFNKEFEGIKALWEINIEDNLRDFHDFYHHTIPYINRYVNWSVEDSLKMINVIDTYLEIFIKDTGVFFQWMSEKVFLRSTSISIKIRFKHMIKSYKEKKLDKELFERLDQFYPKYIKMKDKKKEDRIHSLEWTAVEIVTLFKTLVENINIYLDNKKVFYKWIKQTIFKNRSSYSIKNKVATFNPNSKLFIMRKTENLTEEDKEIYRWVDEFFSIYFDNKKRTKGNESQKKRNAQDAIKRKLLKRKQFDYIFTKSLCASEKNYWPKPPNVVDRAFHKYIPSDLFDLDAVQSSSQNIVHAINAEDDEEGCADDDVKYAFSYGLEKPYRPSIKSIHQPFKGCLTNPIDGFITQEIKVLLEMINNLIISNQSLSERNNEEFQQNKLFSASQNHYTSVFVHCALNQILDSIGFLYTVNSQKYFVIFILQKSIFLWEVA
ncbi:7429_t:CDS:2 [Entrophospora sp. SA101]|nr:7429_t:CDS:2 [Entrophospora sp. SA101]